MCFTQKIYKTSSELTWKPFVWPCILQPVDSENIEIHSVKSRFSPEAEQLGLGVLCCWWKGWLDSLSTSLVPCRFALTARLRAVLQHLQLQEAAAMPTTACLAPQICEKSPKGLWRAMHWETVTLEPLGTGLRSGFISQHLNDCSMTLLLHSEMTSEIRPGFLWPWVGVTVWIS